MTTTRRPAADDNVLEVVEDVDHEWVADDGLLPGMRRRTYVCTLCGARKRVTRRCPGQGATDDEQVDGL